jgi:hypothetical protein
LLGLLKILIWGKWVQEMGLAMGKEEGQNPKSCLSALAFRQHKVHGVPTFFLYEKKRKKMSTIASLYLKNKYSMNVRDNKNQYLQLL